MIFILILCVFEWLLIYMNVETKFVLFIKIIFKYDHKIEHISIFLANILFVISKR